jgi:hypothetical protein
MLSSSAWALSSMNVMGGPGYSTVESTQLFPAGTDKYV